MTEKLWAIVFFASTVCLAACSSTAELTRTQEPHFVSHRVDVGGADWRGNRALIDLFAKEGPYQWVEVFAPSEGDATMVRSWLREDGILDVKVNGSGAQDKVTLVGYWPPTRDVAR